LIGLLQKVIQANDRNTRTLYFHQKYPELSPDDIAIFSVAVRYVDYKMRGKK